jgi:MFS family permease
MPRLADSRGRVLTVIISTAGSCVAYALQSLAYNFPDSGFAWLLSGKIVAGLFGGTFPMLIAYSVELSSPDADLVKYRQTMLITVLMVSPIMLSPIGGGVAR